MAKQKKTASPQKEKSVASDTQSQIHTSFIKPWHYILGLAVICIVFYYRIIFGVGHFWEDLVYQEFPHRIFARDCLIHFQFPHWNPYTFTGMPFFAAIHTGVLYPFNFLMSFLPVSNGTFWYLLQLMIISHIFFAGLSMFIFIRSKKLSDQAAFFAAISYMLCGFFVTHIIHSLMLYILAWLPLIVLFLEKGLKENKLYYLVISGIILGLTIFAGHPQITFYEYLFLGLYCLYIWLSLTERKIITLVHIAIPFAIATGIAMIQLLPTVEIGTNSARVGWTFEQACEGSFSFAQIFTFILPKVFGAWSSPDTQVPQFWLKGPYNGYYTYWDTCFYTGVAIFLFAVTQCKNFKKDTFIKFAVIWCVASLIIALGRNFFIYKLLFNYFPGFGRFRSPARILFTWNFLLPLLAAYTFDQLRKDNIGKLKKPFLIALACCAVIGLVVAIGFFKNFWPAELENKKVADFTAMQGLVLLFNAIFLFIPLLLTSINKLSINTAKILIICALLIDLFVFGFNHHVSKGSNAAKFFSQNKEISQGLIRDSKSEMSRTNSRQFRLERDSMIVHQTGLKLLKRNQGMIDKIYMLEGYNPLNLYRRIPPLPDKQFNAFLDLLNVKFYVNPEYGRTSKTLILLNSDKLPRAKMFYNAKVFNNDSLVKVFMMNNSFDYRKTLLLSNRPDLELPNSTENVAHKVTITKFENNKIELSVMTAKNGLLWLSEIWYPAWKAYIDGKETKILCADYSFRAIEIPEGEHKVKFIYRSSFFVWGALLTFLTLLLSISYLIFAFWRKS